jgi:hypothetical protein
MSENSEQVNEWQNRLGKWDYYLEHVANSDSLSESDKEGLFEGISKLRGIFDDEWLLRAVQTRHPISSYISNYAPWAQFWLADFGRQLDSLRDTPNFDKLVIRLRKTGTKDYIDYGAAEAEALVAWKLKNADFIVELYPSIGEKEADVKAVAANSGNGAYFEVARLGPSDEERQCLETHQSLMMPYHFSADYMEFFKIHKILSELHIKEIKTQIESARTKVKETQDHCYFSEPKVIDYLVIHSSKRDELDVLLSRYCMERGQAGPAYNVHDIDRLRIRLQNKAKQLNQIKPGVIIIRCDLCYFGSDEEFYEELVNELEEELYRYDHLILGVIISTNGSLNAQEKTLQRPNYVFKRRCSHGLLYENTVAIKNKYQYHEFAISDAILKAFVG